MFVHEPTKQQILDFLKNRSEVEKAKIPIVRSGLQVHREDVSSVERQTKTFRSYLDNQDSQ